MGTKYIVHLDDEISFYNRSEWRQFSTKEELDHYLEWCGDDFHYITVYEAKKLPLERILGHPPTQGGRIAS